MNDELVPVDPTLPDELEVPDWVDDEDAPSGNDTFDLMRSYRDEVEALSIENKALKEALDTEVARLKAVIEENAKVYMRAIEYALTAGDNHAITFPH